MEHRKVEQPAILKVLSVGISKWIGFSRSASSLGSAEAFHFCGPLWRYVPPGKPLPQRKLVPPGKHLPPVKHLPSGKHPPLGKYLQPLSSNRPVGASVELLGDLVRGNPSGRSSWESKRCRRSSKRHLPKWTFPKMNVRQSKSCQSKSRQSKSRICSRIRFTRVPGSATVVPS